MRQKLKLFNKIMKIYVVRSSTGLFFRAKGQNGRGDNWVNTLEKAKLYTKIGPAKSTCTFWARHSIKYNQEFGIPDILEFELDEKDAKVLSMKEETNKKIKKIEDKQLASELAWKLRESQTTREEIKNKVRNMTSEEKKKLLKELEGQF